MSPTGHGDAEYPTCPPPPTPPPPGSERPSTQRVDRSPSDVDLDEGVIVVPHRPGGFSAKLLPPLFLVMLGAAFLAYRASASDWRGFSFESMTSLWSTSPRAKAETAKPQAETDTALALKNDTSVPEAESPPEPEHLAKTDADAPKEADPNAGVDPLEDIRREAEKTKEQIAKLEKLKEEESKKLADTADERRRADQNGRRGLAARRIPPEQLKRMIAEQHRRFEQQFALMEAMQRRQFDQMFQNQRELMKRWGMDGGPGLPGQGRMIVPGPGNNFGGPPPDLFMGLPGNAQPEIREFVGPGGVHRFEMRWQGRLRNGFPMEPQPEEVPAPPPAPGIPEGS